MNPIRVVNSVDELMQRAAPIPEAGCWLWTAASTGGYGIVSHAGRQWVAHRLAWVLAHGSDPGAMQVCHKCDTPLCINPDHLFLGTAADNARDKVAKRRDNSPFGERHGAAKLTTEQVAAIRADARLNQIIADEYGVAHQTIWSIKTRLTWRKVA